jgi:hypothetical protein
MVPAEPPRAGTWEREHADDWQSWANSQESDRYDRLIILSEAVQVTLQHLANDATSAKAAIDQLLSTLTSCDDLDFSTDAQVAAYAVWHLVDRYARITLEVGSGPAPGTYSAIDYYTDLANWADKTEQVLSVLPVTHVATVDRGDAWGKLLHILSEMLTPLQSGDRRPLPFGITYRDFRGFSVRAEHMHGIEQAARRFEYEADRFDEYLDPREARRLAVEGRAFPPGAYDLIILCNFLTTTQIVTNLSVEIQDLAYSLTPGGIILVLGSASSTYDDMYSQLDANFRAVHELRPVCASQEPLQAHPDAQARAIVSAHIVRNLTYLRGLAPDAFALVRDHLPPDVRSLNETAVRFPRFKILAFKNQSSTARRRT